VWEEVGETPPPGALSAFATVPPASGDSGAALERQTRTWVVVGDDAGEASLEEHPYWNEPGADEPGADEPGADEPSADGLSADEPEGLVATFPAAGDEASHTEPEAVVPEAEPVASEPVGTLAQADPMATAPSQSAASSTGAEPGFFGPILPAGSAPAVEPAAEEEGEVTTNVRVRRLDPSQVVEPDQRGPRMANASELKGVWLQEAVPPMWTIEEAQKVLTPQVGQVRVILEGNEIFQGRLYAMGEGRVWINNERFGQMGLEGAKVQKILRIDVDDDSPVPGESGSENLGGLESVRVKTPGGILFGKVIARDEVRTTIVTEDGTRVTLASDQVEFLNEAPTVALKRAGEPEAQDQPAAEKPAEGDPADEGDEGDEDAEGDPSADGDPDAGDESDEPQGESPSEPRDAPVQTPAPVKPKPKPVKRP
jgi:hypothetical protein